MLMPMASIGITLLAARIGNMADKRLRENAMKMLPIIGVVAAGIFLGPSAFAETVMYKATLTASAVIPANDSKGSGKADMTFDTATKKLSWKVSFDKLTGEPIAAHFHGPAGPKDNAGPVVDVTANIKDGSATITDAQVADLAAGKWYLNVHTEKFPDGEIRGQVEKVK